MGTDQLDFAEYYKYIILTVHSPETFGIGTFWDLKTEHFKVLLLVAQDPAMMV